MPHAIGGGGKAEASYKIKEKPMKALVVEDVQVIEKIVEVPIYKLVEVPQEQVKYKTKVEEQVKYKTIDKPTIKYNAKEEEVIKYNVKEEETIKYTVKELEVEKPIAVPKEYEKPIIIEKTVELMKYQDMEAVQQLAGMVPQLITQIKEIKAELDKLSSYKLIEKEIEVPKIIWLPTNVERIVWKDVERKRPD